MNETSQSNEPSVESGASSDTKEPCRFAPVPCHKSDFEALAALASLPFPPIWYPDIPKLLDWLLDLNGPICRPVAELLRSVPGKQLAPHLRKIFQGDDLEWQLNSLVFLIAEMDDPVPEILTDVENWYSRRKGDVKEEWDMVDDTEIAIAKLKQQLKKA